MACCLQVEQNLHPSLKGRAFAIQQHQDIIAVSIVFHEMLQQYCSYLPFCCFSCVVRAAAESLQVNYAARGAGVKKHMAPKEVCVLQDCNIVV